MLARRLLPRHLACGDGGGAAAAVEDDHIAGALVNGGVFDGVVVVQIRFQPIGPVQRHADSADVDAHPTAAFM